LRVTTKEAIRVNSDTKTRAFAGLAALVSGVMLIGTSGLTFALGWMLWAAGLAAVLTAIPSGGDDRRRPNAVASLRSRVRRPRVGYAA
jgi:hypothetical protein